MADTMLILVPVDFSPGSDGAASYASWLAGRLGARIRLVHAFVGLGHAAAGVAPGLADDLAAVQREVRRQAERDLAEVAARLAREGADTRAPAPEAVMVEAGGSPADAILAAAREAGADLIVMGTHGRGGLRRMVLGSVAEQVVRAAHCPVLTLR